MKSEVRQEISIGAEDQMQARIDSGSSQPALGGVICGKLMA